MAMGDINIAVKDLKYATWLVHLLTMIEVTASLPSVTDCDCKWSAGVVWVVL